MDRPAAGSCGPAVRVPVRAQHYRLSHVVSAPMKTLKPLLAALVCAAFCVSMGTVPAQEPATTPDHPPQAAANPSKDNDADGAEKTEDEPDREVSKRHAHGKHHGGDDVIALGRNAHLPAGQHADSVVAILGSATSEGDVADSVVAVLGNVRVTGSVQNGVVAIMGGMYIDGRVDGDVIGVAGNVELGPQAHITGDLVVIGGELTRDPTSTVDGDVRSILTGFLPHFE